MLKALFFIWLLITLAVLFSPAETVRQTSADVKSMPAVERHSESTAHKLFFHEDSWHGGLFFVLAVLLVAQFSSLTPRRLFFGLAGLTLTSVATETIQEILIPGRAFEWRDLAANQLGILLGVGLFVLVTTRQGRRRGEGATGFPDRRPTSNDGTPDRRH